MFPARLSSQMRTEKCRQDGALVTLRNGPSRERGFHQPKGTVQLHHRASLLRLLLYWLSHLFMNYAACGATFCNTFAHICSKKVNWMNKYYLRYLQNIPRLPLLNLTLQIAIIHQLLDFFLNHCCSSHIQRTQSLTGKTVKELLMVAGDLTCYVKSLK